jgi:hypothetical protein
MNLILQSFVFFLFRLLNAKASLFFCLFAEIDAFAFILEAQFPESHALAQQFFIIFLQSAIRVP